MLKLVRTYVLPCLLETVSSVKFTVSSVKFTVSSVKFTVSSVKFTVSSVKFINLLTVDFLWLLCRCIALLVSWTGVHCFNEYKYGIVNLHMQNCYWILPGSYKSKYGTITSMKND